MPLLQRGDKVGRDGLPVLFADTRGGFFTFINYIRLGEVLSVVLSVSLLVFSVAQFRRADLQLTQAREANLKAKEALDKVTAAEIQVQKANSKAEASLTRATATEARVLEARRDVLTMTQCVIPIAEILPRTGIYSGGLAEPDNKLLKKNLDCLRSVLGKSKG